MDSMDAPQVELSLYTPLCSSFDQAQDRPSKGGMELHTPRHDSAVTPLSRGELVPRRNGSGMFAGRQGVLPTREEQEAHVQATAERVKSYRLKDTARQMIVEHFERWYVVESARYKTKRDALGGYCRLYMLKGLDLPKDVYAKVKKVSVASVYRWQKEIEEASTSLENRTAAPLIGAESVDLKGFLMPFETGLTELQQRIVLNYFLNQGELKTATIHANLLRSGHGDGVTYSAVYRYLNNIEVYNKDIVTYARKGPTAYANKVKSYIERDWNTLDPDELWIADGHRLDIAFRDPRTGKAKRATTVVFLDARSRRMTGFSLHWTESTDSALQSLSMGLALSGTPRYILFDNGTAFKNNRMLGQDLDTVKVKGVLDYFGIEPIWSIPGNPRSKPVERFFRTLKDQFSRLWSTFTGGHPFWKPEQLEHLVKAGELPELGELFQFLAKYFDQYNSTPHTSLPFDRAHHKHLTPNQVYGTVKHTRHDIESLKVCMRKAFTGSCQRNGFKVDKVWYYHPKYVPKLVGNGKKYIIYLNDYDGSSVDVHDDRDRYLFSAWPLDKLDALAQLSDAGRAELARRMHIQNMNSKAVKNSVAAIAEGMPEDAKIENLLQSIEVKQLKEQEAINSLPVDDLDQHPAGKVDGYLYGDEYDPIDLDE